MRRFMLLVALLFAATSYAVPVITSITPDEGSEFGGTEVVIRGSNFVVCNTCDATQTVPQVWFGDRQAGTVGWIDSTELHAYSPEHAPGPVTVTVRQVENGVVQEASYAEGFTYLEEQFKMTPTSGPQSGGTVVTITGPFGSWPYSVVFGETHVPGFRVNENTLVAVTPPGSGNVPVRIFEYDVFLHTNIVFRYVQEPGDGQERVLLPLLTPPVNGALGSRFHTELRAINRIDWDSTDIFGLAPSCSGNCPAPNHENPMTIRPRGELLPTDIAYDGRPGRFIYVDEDAGNRLWLNLRVYDSTRTTNNFGTELPVVRDRDFFRNSMIFFSAVPSEPNFRNTLRIYATAPTTIDVAIETGSGSRTSAKVALRPGLNRFDPAYAQFSDFPSNAGPIRVVLTPPAPGEAGFGVPYWAFISVTNNDTQFITTIRP